MASLDGCLNLSSLENSLYIKQIKDKNKCGKEIHRYILKNSKNDSDIDSAVVVIENLLKDNPELIFVSPPDEGKELRAKVASNKYLVINGLALCLSNKPRAPYGYPQDGYFSEALLGTAVMCKERHVFEKEYITNWVKHNLFCPADKKKHEIGEIRIDEGLNYRVKRANETYEEENKLYEESNKKLDEQNSRLNIQALKLELLNNTKNIDKVAEISVSTLKITGKAVIGGFSKVGCKTGSCVLHSVGKKLPILSLGIGFCLSLGRLYKGEKVKALAELLSGAIACAPGYGILASAGIDAVLLGLDIKEHGKVNIELNSENSHKILGLDPNQEIKKEQIDKAFRDVSFCAHPDLFSGKDRENAENLQKAVEEARDILYKHYKYS